jgi:hypothetical protein
MSEINITTVREFRRECRSYGDYLRAFADDDSVNEIQLNEPLTGDKEKLRQILKIISMVPLPAYRILIWRSYVQKHSIKSLAEELNFSSDYLLKSVKEQIRIALEQASLQS